MPFGRLSGRTTVLVLRSIKTQELEALIRGFDDCMLFTEDESFMIGDIK